MSRFPSSRGRGLASLLLPLVLLALAGCVPEETWLDDSSGFVYTRGKDDLTKEIRFYDISRKAERIIWSGSYKAGDELDTAAGVLYIAESKRGAGEPSWSLRLTAYGIKTNRVVRTTRWMTWDGNEAQKSKLQLTRVPNHKAHFLVRDNGGSGQDRWAVLNADTESLLDVPAGHALDTDEGVLYSAESKRDAGEPSWSCRLTAYDIKANRVVRTTRWMTWDGNDAEKSVLQLTPVPSHKGHFLVRDNGGSGRSAILNADTESLLDVPGFDLEVVPDGSGFLATNSFLAKTWDESLKAKTKRDDAAIKELCQEYAWFIDLEGFRYRIAWDDAALGYATALYGEQLKKAEASADPKKESFTGLLSGSERAWQGKEGDNPPGTEATILVLAHEGGATRIDLKRRQISDVAGLTLPKEKGDPNLEAQLAQGSVLLVKLKDVEYRANIIEQPDQDKGRDYFIASLEARWPAQGKAKTLLNRVNITNASLTNAGAPNGLYGVLSYEEPKKDKEERGSRIHYLIVDNEGQVLDRLFFMQFEHPWLD